MSHLSASLTARLSPRRPGLDVSEARPDTGRNTTGTKDRPLTILVVDDVTDTRRMYAGYFEFVGARVVTARDGVEALQAIYHHRPDVVLLDLAMPRMTGFEVLESLRRDARQRDLPVIAITGHVAYASKSAALEAGADLYLTKPCLPHAVFSHIVQLLRTGPDYEPRPS
jgi:two-component system, cell cycle response regulator DivK